MSWEWMNSFGRIFREERERRKLACVMWAQIYELIDRLRPQVIVGLGRVQATSSGVLKLSSPTARSAIWE